MMNSMRIPLLVALLLVIAACGASDDGSADATTSAPPTTTVQSTSTIDPTSTTKVPAVTLPPGDDDAGAPPVYTPGDDAVAFAVADLAFRLGVAEEEVTLVEQTEVVWRDGSIGCPVPGMSYTQALVDGSRIILEVGGEEYSYHQGGGRAPFLCENPAE